MTSLTKLERRLLQLLQENARQTNRDLARAAGVAESTCLERIRSLQQRGVIRGFHADIAPEALGRTVRALITIRVQPKTTESVQAFQSMLLKSPEVVSVATVAGADDFIVEVALPSVEKLNTFVLDVITSRVDVFDARTSLVFDHKRKNVLPMLDGSA